MNKQILLKYCGNQSLEDLQITAASRAQYLGFIFAESKRRVTPQQVQQWLTEIDVTQKIVGVFVNAPFEEIEDVIAKVPLDIIQCHGEETVEYILSLRAFYNKKIWKVIHHSKSGPQFMAQYAGIVDAFIVDSKVGNLRGGTGVTFDWTSIPLYQKEALKQNVPIFIAGGINEYTVSKLLQYNPTGIDLASGIEVNGRKSLNIKNKFEERLFHELSISR